MRNNKSRNLIKVIMLAAVVTLAAGLKVEARPPSQIELTYDKDKQSLHIVAKHLSESMREHYIRKVDVWKNDEDPIPHFFSSQTSAAELITDIPLSAMPNDVIHVEAVCSKAGRTQQSLVVQE